MLLKDKVVVVSGGEGLIGKTIVKSITNQGGIPISADINFSSNKEIEYINMDITSKISIENAIEYVYKKYGKDRCFGKLCIS